MTKKLKSINLNTYDDLFTNASKDENQLVDQVVDLPTEEIKAFNQHPFQVRMDEDMERLLESIQERGILMPVLVRPQADGYEMIAGHRRKQAAELLRIKEIPSIIREIADDEAIILMVDSNIQRENILPSERGFAYRMKLEAMNRQGERVDLTSSQVGTKLKRADELLAEQVRESRNQVQRYIRLTHLIPEILEYLDGFREDKKKISFNAAVELSFLNEEDQKTMIYYAEEHESLPTLAQSQHLKELSKKGELTDEMIEKILLEEKPNQKEKLTFKMEEIDSYFPKEYTPLQKKELVIELLHKWAKKREKEKHFCSNKR